MVRSSVLKLATGLFVGVFLIFSCSEEDNPEPGLNPQVAVELLNTTYGTNPRQVMDVFLPANRSTENTKVLVWIHGGGWIDGSKDEFIQFKPWLEAVQDDYAYVTVNYRLFNISTGLNKFPSQEEDIKTAMSYIKSQLADWDVSDEIVLAGGSAGGHLALLHSYKNNQDGLVKATVAFFPPTELKSFYNFNQITQLLLTNLLGGTPTSIPAVYTDSSPLTFLKSNSVPTVLFHGNTDTVVPISQSEILANSLANNGVPHYVEYIEGQGHGFTIETYQDLILKMQDFLEKVLE
jgi:acetyl esterase/lipase